MSCTEGSNSGDGQACWSVLESPVLTGSSSLVTGSRSDLINIVRGSHYSPGTGQSITAGARREHLQTCRPAVLTLTSMQTCRPYTDLQTSSWPAWHEATYCSALDTSQAFLIIDVGTVPLIQSYRTNSFLKAIVIDGHTIMCKGKLD